MATKKSKRKRRKLLNWIFILVVLAVVVFIAWQTFKKTQKETQWKLQPHMATESVYVGDLQLSILASATLHPFETVQVRPEASGRIEELFVDVGDWVEEGDPIALLDQEDLEIRVQTARAQLARAQAQLEFTRRGYVPRELQANEARIETAQLALDEALEDLQYTQELFDASFASDEELDTAEYNVEQARQNLDQAKDALDVLLEGGTAEEISMAQASVQVAQASVTEAELALGDATIYAPMSGVILDRFVTEGDVVVSTLASFAGGDSMFIIGDTSNMKAVASVDENDIGVVEIDQLCLLDVDSYPDEVFEGTVLKIHPQATQTGGVTTFTTEIEVPNPEGRLMAGMSAEAEIITEKFVGILLVPDRALADKDDQWFVFVVKEDESIEAREVEIGRTNYEFTEVLSGLEEGEEVIVRGVPRDLLDEVEVDDSISMESGEEDSGTDGTQDSEDQGEEQSGDNPTSSLTD